MANSDAAFGFKPINRDGSPYNGATLRCVIAAADETATFLGDPVTLDGTSDQGYPGVSQCAAAEPVFGVVTSFEANPDSLGDQYRKALTKRFCQVATAENTYFECQEDGDGTDLLAVEVGLNAGYEVAAGSTVYGTSGFELDASDAATTSTLDLQIVALVDAPDNILLSTGNTNKRVIVKFNDTQSKSNRVGV